jgi:serine protease Do
MHHYKGMAAVNTVRRLCLLLGCCALTGQAQSTSHKSALGVLDQFSDSVQALAARVAPSVVQISVTRYAPREDTDGERTGAVLGRQQSVGSGVIIDPDGYIVTNAHVVANALRIRVSLPAPKAQPVDGPDQTITNTLAQALAPPVEASLVGVFKELDLALIKIPEKGLPALRFADYRKLRQGQVVFAFGSRQGLGNSMSMGVVSSVARQPEPDSPFVYIQTDAPINPGDSGGPLVNTAGEVVGLDTFILSQSGGSEGIGFAIPSPLIELTSAQLRKYGHVHRQLIGVGVQTITATMASALVLPRNSGVLVSDVTPEGPAEGAGVKLNDIVAGVDGRRVENVPMFVTAMLAHPSGQKVKLDLLRSGEMISLDVTPIEESHNSDRLSDLIDPEKNRVRQLGIIGLAVDEKTAKLLPDLRGSYGVVVTALSASATASGTGLEAGDVIHQVNDAVVTSVDALRTAMDKFKRGDAVALFIERDGKLQYLAFEVE